MVTWQSRRCALAVALLRRDHLNGDKMRLNHLDLHVPDVAAARDFFCNCLGLTEIETRGANGLAILHDDVGLELEIGRAHV